MTWNFDELAATRLRQKSRFPFNDWKKIPSHLKPKWCSIKICNFLHQKMVFLPLLLLLPLLPPMPLLPIVSNICHSDFNGLFGIKNEEFQLKYEKNCCEFKSCRLIRFRLGNWFFLKSANHQTKIGFHFHSHKRIGFDVFVLLLGDQVWWQPMKRSRLAIVYLPLSSINIRTQASLPSI